MNGLDPAPRSDSLSMRTFVVLAAGLAVLFLVLLRVTWLRWGDPIVDTGRGFEIPWKITMGKVLYRDMAYNYGPFSVHWNAAFLWLFGLRVESVVASGVLGAGVGMVLVFATARVFVGRTAALVVVVVFLFESVFQHYFVNGNFNFILPYSFAAVHGMLFALAAFLALSRFLGRGGRGALAGAGVLLALSALCKVEIAGAIAVPVALVPCTVRFARGQGMRAAALDTASWAGPFLVVLGVGFLPFVLASSARHVVLENVLKPELVGFAANPFLLKRLGVAGMEENVLRLASSAVRWVAALAVLAAGSRLAARDRAARGALRRTTAVALGGAVVGACVLLLTADLEFRVLPVGALLVLGTSAWAVLRRGRRLEVRDARLLALSLFALLSLGRILFTAGTFHYGFCLAVPGLVLLCVLGVELLPHWFPRACAHRGFHAGALLAVLAVLSVRNFSVHSLPNYARKDVEIRGVSGRLRAMPRPGGVNLARAVEYLGATARDGDTLLVLPEGATVNFLTRQPNPTPYDLFIPPELNAPGREEDVLAALRGTAVDRILVVDRPVGEYGFRGLGVDYGQALMDFVREHYEERASFGPPPFGAGRGGCVVYGRRGSAVGKGGVVGEDPPGYDGARR